MPEISDEELNAYILTRLKMLGIDLGVLPESDPDAPADRRRIMESARRFLRTTPPAIAEVYLDPQLVPPALYPVDLTGPSGGDPDAV